MTDLSPEFRAQFIKLRRLEIIATLAAWKRDYIVNGIPRTLAERVTLEAELADLVLEQRVIGDAAHKAKVERREKLNASLLVQLQAVLTERGMPDVIEEAQRRADALYVEVRHLPADDTEGGDL
jgi:hypothetical protein